MKDIYILKIISDGKIGYYDGGANWSAEIDEAKRFNDYPAALEFLREAIEVNGWGGYIQIEKYFINV